jgi:hypothetical protein
MARTRARVALRVEGKLLKWYDDGYERGFIAPYPGAATLEH